MGTVEGGVFCYHVKWEIELVCKCVEGEWFILLFPFLAKLLGGDEVREITKQILQYVCGC